MRGFEHSPLQFDHGAPIMQTELLINFRPRLISEYVISSTPVDRRLLYHQQDNTRRGEGVVFKGKDGNEETKSKLKVRIRGGGYCDPVSSLRRQGTAHCRG